jgi:uncharacterized cupredoxin-like copper-binding protein
MRWIEGFLVLMLVGIVAPTGSGAEPARTINISAKEYRFTPSKISVRAGQRVKLVISNVGTVKHEFVSPAAFKASENIQGVKVGDSEIEVSPGKTMTIVMTPTKPGTYAFWCGEQVGGKLHRDLGMRGTLVVTK